MKKYIVINFYKLF